MYLEKAIFYNRAPLEHLTLDFKKDGINVLSAINGKGKTTVLSYIVDAFHEMARPHFTTSFEGKENKYYRISSSQHSINPNSFSFVYFRFRENEAAIDYMDCRGEIPQIEYEKLIPLENKIDFAKIEKKIKSDGNIKILSKNFTKEEAKKIFSNNILTYFPSYRYEQPGYLNEPYKIKIEHQLSLRFSDELPNSIEVIKGLPQLANWLTDVILDKMLYQTNPVHSLLQTNFNTILNATLGSKLNQSVRIGLGDRNQGSARISVTQQNGQVIYPSIFNMSSGEAALLCIFGELLRQADVIGKNTSVSGIVLIDEIDKHLHIKLQKEILPNLFSLFPNIQFIVSSHSPFLSMGLAEKLLEHSQIIDLDNNGIVCTPTNNNLYEEVYNLMINENERFFTKYRELEAKIASGTKTLIITEGKTDVKHIKKAKEMLDITDDYDFIEPENQPSGWDDLERCLTQLGKIKHARKIIGIFDRDDDELLKKLKPDTQPYKKYGNGIYGFCIQIPKNRIDNNQTKISIEYLYTDDEVKTTLENGCRLFFGTEFTKNSLWHNSENLTLSKPNGKGEDKILENNSGQAVYDTNDNNFLAKKDDFADAVLTGKVVISEESWQNFSHIFDKIRELSAV